MIVSLSRRKKAGVLSVQVPPIFALDTDLMKEFESFWLVRPPGAAVRVRDGRAGNCRMDGEVKGIDWLTPKMEDGERKGGRNCI